MLSSRGHFKRKFFSFNLAAVLCIVPLALAGQNNAKAPATNPATNSGAWSGTLVSSSCNADEAFNESPDCTKNLPGAKLALYDDTSRVMYGLAPQESVTAHLGDSVTVHGTLDGDTIRLASMEPMS